MKLTQKHFEIFKKECLKYQDIFELHNWDLHFRWQNSDTDRASCHNKVSGYISTLFLSRNWEGHGQKITDDDIKEVAKHEMIHVLLERVTASGRYRYVSENEMEEAEEELVRKLEYLL